MVLESTGYDVEFDSYGITASTMRTLERADFALN
jgi:hypothetical protein